MRPTFDRRLWILLTPIILIQCIPTNQQNIKPQNSKSHQYKTPQPSDTPSPPAWNTTAKQSPAVNEGDTDDGDSILVESFLRTTADDIRYAPEYVEQSSSAVRNPKKLCAKNCLESKNSQSVPFSSTYALHNHDSSLSTSVAGQLKQVYPDSSYATTTPSSSSFSSIHHLDYEWKPNTKNIFAKHKISHVTLPSNSFPFEGYKGEYNEHPIEVEDTARYIKHKLANKMWEHQKLHVAHRIGHKELKTSSVKVNDKRKHSRSSLIRARRGIYGEATILNESTEENGEYHSMDESMQNTHKLPSILPPSGSGGNFSSAVLKFVVPKQKRSHSTVTVPEEILKKHNEPIIIIDDVEEFDSGSNTGLHSITTSDDKSEDYSHDDPPEPRVLPLRPVPPNPYDSEEMSVVYAEQHSEIRLMCEVDLDIESSMWYKNGQVVHAMDRTSRVTDYRFIKEANGALTITNVMLEDDGKWQCEAENARHYTENARPVKLVVLDRPKPPYLLIDSRRLDAGNIFVPVQENSELNLACISEGGNPKPTLTWEVLLSPGVDRHAQKVSAEVLELEEVKNDKDKNVYKINSGAKSEARLPVVYRAHHNARILCVMEHPTLKIRQNASLLLDVQYTPSFAISRTPGFGYPLREGIEVSLKCDVDSNPPSTPRWQKDDGDTPVPQTGDGFLNFTSIRREHSGWYKCTSRHLNLQYSSIGYYLSVRYDSVDVTSEPDDQDISVAAASHNPNKQGQLEVQLGGAVTLQCPQGSLGCWSHLDPVTARLRGLGHGLSTPTGQVSLKDVVYQDAGTYKCIGQSPTNKKKLEVLQTVGVSVKGAPTVMARNATPVAYPGSPLHLAVEFCANPPAHAARWLHGDRVFTPGNQYGSTVLAYAVTDLPTPYCKEARLTYVSMHERVPRTFYFIVSSPGGVAEATFKVNFTMRYRTLSNAIDDEEEELSEPEEIHFPVFGSPAAKVKAYTVAATMSLIAVLRLLSVWCLK